MKLLIAILTIAISYAQAATQIIVSGGQNGSPYYKFNGNYTVPTLVRGQEYTFKEDGVSTAHPFSIGQTYGGTLLSSGQTYNITVPSSGELWYWCTIHPVMKAKFTLVAASTSASVKCSGNANSTDDVTCDTGTTLLEGAGEVNQNSHGQANCCEDTIYYKAKQRTKKMWGDVYYNNHKNKFNDFKNKVIHFTQKTDLQRKTKAGRLLNFTDFKLDDARTAARGKSSEVNKKTAKKDVALARREIIKGIMKQLQDSGKEEKFTVERANGGFGKKFEDKLTAKNIQYVDVKRAKAKQGFNDTNPNCTNADVDLSTLQQGDAYEIVLEEVAEFSFKCLRPNKPLSRLTMVKKNETDFNTYKAECWNHTWQVVNTTLHEDDSYKCGGYEFFVASDGGTYETSSVAGCTSHTCPAGKVHIRDATSTDCAGTSCDSTDDSTCCEDGYVFGLANIELCPDDDPVLIVWAGQHNIQESEEYACDSNITNVPFTFDGNSSLNGDAGFLPSGTRKNISAIRLSSWNSTRHFRCTQHCTGARLNVTCNRQQTTACAQGYWKDTSGNANVCVACVAGKWSDEAIDSETSCKLCDVGKFSAAVAAQSSGTCVACAAGSNTNGQTGQPSCDFCDKGYGGGQQGVCVECPIHTYNNVTSLQSTAPCADHACPLGRGVHASFNTTTNKTHTTQCEACEGAGEYSDSDTAGQCQQCGAGTVPNAERTGCDACTGNTYSTNGTCVPCGAGTVPNAGRTGCDACTGNTYSTNGTCVPCGTGTVPNAGRTGCDACTGNTYSTNGTCVPCGAGTVPNAGRTGCNACTGNTYSTNGTCVPCAAGSNTNGQTGQSSCGFCDKGYGGDQSVCGVCPTHTYNNVTSLQSTAPCADHACPLGQGVHASFNMTTNKTHTTQCEACDGAGEYSDSDTAGQCQQCPSGTEPNAGRTACDTTDTQPPVITIIGDSVTRLSSNSSQTYVDDGAACQDVVDGNLNHQVEVSGQVVNLANTGTYVIYYNCKDSSDNQAQQVNRTVIVIDEECVQREAQYDAQCLETCDHSCVELKKQYKLNC